MSLHPTCWSFKKPDSKYYQTLILKSEDLLIFFFYMIVNWSSLGFSMLVKQNKKSDNARWDLENYDEDLSVFFVILCTKQLINLLITKSSYLQLQYKLLNEVLCKKIFFQKKALSHANRLVLINSTEPSFHSLSCWLNLLLLLCVTAQLHQHICL